MRQWMLGILGSLLVLVAASHVSATVLRVTLISEVSDERVWRFEVVNDSVDALDVVRLTAIFYAGDRRLWSQPAVLDPPILRRGEAGWVVLDARLIPKQVPLRIDWELTWNPHSVPVLPKFWRTERAASIEIRPEAPSAGVSQPPDVRSPGRTPRDPTWRF